MSLNVAADDEGGSEAKAEAGGGRGEGAAAMAASRWEDTMEAYGLGDDDIPVARRGWTARRREAVAGKRLRAAGEDAAGVWDEGGAGGGPDDAADESFGSAVARERARRARRDAGRAERVALAARREAAALERLERALENE